MALIRHGKPALDNWQLLDGDVRAALQRFSDDTDVIVPLASWVELSSELRAHRGGVGVCLAGSDDADVPALKGWRREMFGEKAIALKHGRLALAVEKHRVVAVER